MPETLASKHFKNAQSGPYKTKPITPIDSKFFKNAAAVTTGGGVVDAAALAQINALQANIDALNNNNATQTELDAVAAQIAGKVDQTVYDALVAGNASDAEVEAIRAVLQGEIDTLSAPVASNTARISAAEVQIEALKNAPAGAEPIAETHIQDTENPHGLTKDKLGLKNVDDTSDVSKPISEATQTALDQKATATELGTEIQRATDAETLEKNRAETEEAKKLNKTAKATQASVDAKTDDEKYINSKLLAENLPQKAVKNDYTDASITKEKIWQPSILRADIQKDQNLIYENGMVQIRHLYQQYKSGSKAKKTLLIKTPFGTNGVIENIAMSYQLNVESLYNEDVAFIISNYMYDNAGFQYAPTIQSLMSTAALNARFITGADGFYYFAIDLAPILPGQGSKYTGIVISNLRAGLGSQFIKNRYDEVITTWDSTWLATLDDMPANNGQIANKVVKAVAPPTTTIGNASATYVGLPAVVAGQTQVAALTEDDIGTGDAQNPQYKKGWYTVVASVWQWYRPFSKDDVLTEFAVNADKTGASYKDEKGDVVVFDIAQAADGDVVNGTVDKFKLHKPKQLNREIKALIHGSGYTLWEAAYDGYGDGSTTINSKSRRYAWGDDGILYRAMIDHIAAGVNPVGDTSNTWVTTRSTRIFTTAVDANARIILPNQLVWIGTPSSNFAGIWVFKGTAPKLFDAADPEFVMKPDTISSEILPDYPLGLAPVVGTSYIAVAPNNTANELVNERYHVEALTTDVIPDPITPIWWDDATKMRVIGKHKQAGNVFGHVSNGGTRILNTNDIKNSEVQQLIIAEGRSKTFWFMHPPANLTLFNDLTGGLVTRSDQAGKVIIQVQGAAILTMTKEGNGGQITIVKSDQSGNDFTHQVATQMYWGTQPTGIQKGETIFDLENHKLYDSNGDDTFKQVQKSRFAEFMTLEVKSPKSIWHWDKFTEKFKAYEIEATRSYTGANYPTQKRENEFLFSIDNNIIVYEKDSIRNVMSDRSFHAKDLVLNVLAPSNGYKWDAGTNTFLSEAVVVGENNFSLVSARMTATMGARNAGQYFDIGWTSKWDYEKLGKPIEGNSFEYILTPGTWELEMNLVQVEANDWMAGWWESNGSKVGNTGTTDAVSSSTRGPSPARAFIDVPAGQTRKVKFKMTDSGTPQIDGNSTGGCTFYIKKIR